jgi:SET domain-containing protein
MPQLDGLEVYRSTIHGYGVRATRSFSRGDIVIIGDGVLWREDEEFDDEYALILPGFIPKPDGSEGPPLYYDLADQTRWINHSCDPSTEVDVKWNAETQFAVPWWYALRDIEPGDELTYDYAFSGHLAVPCNCATAICRGVIVDLDEADLVPEGVRHLLRRDLRAKAG